MIPKPPNMSAYRDRVVPGDSALGLTYDELMALGNGSIHRTSNRQEAREQAPCRLIALHTPFSADSRRSNKVPHRNLIKQTPAT